MPNVNVSSMPSRETVRLWDRVDVPVSCTHMAAVRMSDPDAREELKKLQVALRNQTQGSAIGAALALLGADITEDTPEGERDRRRAGLVPVLLRDLDPRAPGKLLAYAGMVRDVLVALIPSSAIVSDLPPHVGDRIGAPRNASTELVLEPIFRLPALELLAVPRLNRLVRRVAFQGDVLDALREHEVQLWADTGVRDLMDPTAMLMTNMEGTTKGDGDAIALKQNTLGGRINALDPGESGFSRRDFRHHASPTGYEAEMVDMPDGSRIPAKGSIRPRLTDQPAVKTMWEMFAAGASRRKIGEAMAPLGLRLRDGSGRTFAELSSTARQDRMFGILTPDVALLHQTGQWMKERSTSAPIRTAGGRRLTRRPDGRRAATIPGRLEVPLIDGNPWGVEPQVWKAVHARFDRERRQTPAERGGQWSTGLMHMSPMFWTAGAWHRLVREHTTLQLRRIDGGTKGDPVEWDPADSTLVASVNHVRAWNMIGKGLLGSAALAGAMFQEVTLLPGAEPDFVRRLRADLCRAEGQVSEYGEAAKVSGELAAVAQGAGNTAAAAEHLTRQDEQLRAAEQSRAEAASLQLALDEALAQPRDERAELASPLAVGAALMRWDGTPDRSLKEAVRALGVVESMTGAYDPRSGEITVITRAEVRSPDGTRGTIPVQVALPNTSNKRPVGVADSLLVKAWASGVTLEELAARYGRSPRWVRQALYRWLRAVGIYSMATSLVDNPVLVTRQAVVATVAPKLVRMPRRDSAGTRLAKRTVDVLAAPYLNDAGGCWDCWAGYTHAPDRRLVAALRAAGGEADVAALEVAAGADPARLSGPFGNRPALTTSPAQKKRRLRECPHEDCGNRWASHVLYVPETAGFGCVCPKCLRFPDLAYADAPLPPEYAAKWERGTREGRLVTVRSSAAALRLPDPALAAIAGDLVRPGEVARIVGVTLSHVSDLRRRGELPVPALTKPVTLWRRSECVALAAQRAIVARTAIKDGWLSPARAATRLGVPEHRVRQYCEEGLLAYRRIGRGLKARVRLNPAVVAAFTPPQGDLLRALTITDVCTRSGFSRRVVLAAIESGELGSVPSSSGQRRVLPEQYEEWIAARGLAVVRRERVEVSAGMSRPGDGRVSVSAAARLLGLSAKQVRRLADKGVLEDHRSAGGWRWFDAGDVQRFAEQRRR